MSKPVDADRYLAGVVAVTGRFGAGRYFAHRREDDAKLATIAARRPSVDLGTAILEQLAAARLIGAADQVLPERRELIRHRRELLRALLAEHLPDLADLEDVLDSVATGD